MRNANVFVLMTTLVIGTRLLAAAPVSTAFTYQGQLKDGGVPADGLHDMRFTLFDAASAGAAVGSPVTINDWDVVNGLFSVELDFGANPFDGNARWLLIEVRPGASAGAYTALSPRQPLTVVPYAMYAMDGPGQAGFWTANGNHIYKSNSGSVGIGATDPQANLEVRSSGTPRLRVAKIHTGGFGVFAPAILELKSNFTGTDLPYGRVNFLDGSDAVRSTIEYGNGPGLLEPVSLRLGTAGQTRMAITDAGDVGIGTTAPAYALDVVGRSRVQQAPGGASAGIWFYQSTPGEDRGFIGMRNDLQLGLWGSEGIGWGLVMDVANGNVGVGTTSPAAKVHITGGSDTAPGGGGFLVTGDVAGANISMDNNEIMARNGGVVAPLYLNFNGGDVLVGGALDIGYQIVTDQSTGTTANADCPTGKKAIGGGCECSFDSDDPYDIEVSRPYQSGNGWRCECSGGAEIAEAYAICVRVK